MNTNFQVTLATLCGFFLYMVYRKISKKSQQKDLQMKEKEE